MSYATLLIPLFLFLSGYLLSRFFFRSPGALSVGERWFLPFVFAACFGAWLSLTLAALGAFTLFNVGILTLVLCGGILLFALFSRSRHQTSNASPPITAAWSFVPSRLDWVFLAILVLAVVLFARPAEYFIGNSDAGTYVNTGAHIARTGALTMFDPQVAQLAPDVEPTFFWQLPNPYMLFKQARLPGFFVADPVNGIVLPQFLHLYPAWLALWDAALGVRLGLYATPLIALLGSVAFYFLARNLFGQRLARLAFFLLVITVPQFWFARYPVAEAMTQFLALTGMYALFKMSAPRPAAAPNRVGFGLLAGIAFGELFLTRSDSLLFLLPLALYALFLIFFRKWRREHWAMYGAFGVLFLQAVVHIVVFAPTYLYFQLTHALRMQNVDKLFRIELPEANTLFTRPESLIVVVIFLALGSAAVFIADRIVQWARRRWGKAASERAGQYEKFARVGGALLVVLFVGLLYLILPRVSSPVAYIGGITPTDTAANLVKLGWYLSPIAIALATLGAVVVVLRDLNARNAFFFGTAAFFAVFYLDELYSNPHYIYTLRHYIPLVIPLFILLAARALQWLWQGGPTRLVSPQRANQLRAVTRVIAASAFGLWMLYNLYVMGIVDPCGAQRCAQDTAAIATNLEANAPAASGPVIRVPFLSNPVQAGALRLEPFERSITGITELGGVLTQLETLANALGPNPVIVMSGNKRDEPALLAAPLTYVFGRDALVVAAEQPDGALLAKQIDTWRAQGRDVVLGFGTNGGITSIPGYALEPIGAFGLDAPQWTFAYDVMPRVPWRLNVTYGFYRAVPEQSPAAYPFTLDFGGADYPYLVRGFLERPPQARTRWLGGLLADNSELGTAEWVSGEVRIPVTTSTRESLKLTLRARAPRDNVELTLSNNGQLLGQQTLSTTMQTYTFEFLVSQLDLRPDGYLLEFATQTTPDNKGRILGAELESLTIE